MSEVLRLQTREAQAKSMPLRFTPRPFRPRYRRCTDARGDCNPPPVPHRRHSRCLQPSPAASSNPPPVQHSRYGDAKCSPLPTTVPPPILHWIQGPCRMLPDLAVFFNEIRTTVAVLLKATSRKFCGRPERLARKRRGWVNSPRSSRHTPLFSRSRGLRTGCTPYEIMA